MTINTIKRKIREILGELQQDFFGQVRIEEVCVKAKIDREDLYEVIRSSMVSYGLYNFDSLVNDVGGW